MPHLKLRMFVLGGGRSSSFNGGMSLFNSDASRLFFSVALFIIELSRPLSMDFNAPSIKLGAHFSHVTSYKSAIVAMASEPTIGRNVDTLIVFESTAHIPRINAVPK